MANVNILDLAIKSAGRKSLVGKLLQLKRAFDGSDRRLLRARRSKSNNDYFSDVENLFWNLDEEIFDTGLDNLESGKKWWKDCLGSNPDENHGKCYEDWLFGEWVNHIPEDFEKTIRLDPLNYVDSHSKIISNFSKKLINGEIE